MTWTCVGAREAGRKPDYPCGVTHADEAQAQACCAKRKRDHPTSNRRPVDLKAFGVAPVKKRGKKGKGPSGPPAAPPSAPAVVGKGGEGGGNAFF